MTSPIRGVCGHDSQPHPLAGTDTKIGGWGYRRTVNADTRRRCIGASSAPEFVESLGLLAALGREVAGRQKFRAWGLWLTHLLKLSRLLEPLSRRVGCLSVGSPFRMAEIQSGASSNEEFDPKRPKLLARV